MSEDASIFGHMAAQQTHFEEHPFFQYLEQNPPTDWLHHFVPGMAFWVMTFQDVLRVIEDRVKAPQMRAIASHIRQGDKGHDNWFLSDMVRLGLTPPDIEKLFGPEHDSARSASYAIMSEVYRAQDDRLLIVLLLALESASYVFFGSMTNYLENNNYTKQLHYFGRTHLDAELKHGIVEAEMDNQVERAVEKSPEVHQQAIQLIDRIFDAFYKMFSTFVPPGAMTAKGGPSHTAHAQA